MPLVDLVDETFLAVPARRLATEFADPSAWARWWPTLRLELAEGRGDKGVRWQVVGEQLRGTSEVWLEQVRDGTVVHFYLRVDPVDAPSSRQRARRLADRLRRAHAVAFKRRLNALKDELEAGRPPGERVGRGRSTLRPHG